MEFISFINNLLKNLIMFQVIILTIVFAVICSIGQSAYAPDEIINLPGWTGALPSKQYSGYLQANTSMLHYWFVQSEGNPATDPTVLWFNGGPGCSSLDGFFYELGPFEINADNTLSLREYRWNLKANVLFIEAPVGVGFSYSTTNSYNLNDDRTANENLLAVQSFFTKFPEYLNNKMFITGESYAGVYVPTLAEAILKATEAGTYTGAKLTGIAVGNGCSGNQVGICGDGTQGTWYEWNYLIQTPFVDPDLKNSVNAACNWTAAALNEAGALSEKCVSLLNSASLEIGHVDLYNIYGDCVDGGCSGADGTRRGKVPRRADYVVADNNGNQRRLARIIPHGPDACIDSTRASAYLGQQSVQTAIHVNPINFCWGVCNTVNGWQYTETRANLPRDTYPYLYSRIQVIIYNGDWDACVPYTDAEGWIASLQLPVKTAWHNWKYTSEQGNAGQVAGYSVAYDVSPYTSSDPKVLGQNGNSFTYVKVRGGRHEVPESAPGKALEMLTRLIANTAF